MLLTVSFRRRRCLDAGPLKRNFIDDPLRRKITAIHGERNRALDRDRNLGLDCYKYYSAR